MRRDILWLAARGQHREKIAKRFSISSGSRTNHFQSTDIVLRRKQIRFESTRRRYRVAILRFLHSSPNAKRKDIFKMGNSAAHWLFTNDNAWLQAVLPEAQKPQLPQH